MPPAKTITITLLTASAFIATHSICGAQDVEPTPAEMKLIRLAEQERIASIENVYGTVVSILGANNKGTGSGVLFHESGFALTNHHVVAAVGKKGKAGLSDGKTYRWDLIGTDTAGDIAIIQLHGRDTWPVAKIGDSKRVRRGDWTMAMGNPFGLAEDHTPTVTLGIVSGVHRYQGGGMVYGNCIQVDASINPGNSGGPLMNMQGEVIGINGRAAFAERGRVSVGVGFAVSAEQVLNFIPDLLATKVAQHGTLDAQFGMRDGEVICESINLDSRAARAGLKLGDRLVSVNGEPIETSNELANVLAMLPADWPVHVSYEHEGQPFDLSVRLSALTLASSTQPPPVEKAPPEKEEQEGEPKEKRVRRRPRLPRLAPGSQLSTKKNRENAKQILQHWQNAVAGADSKNAIAIQWSDEVQTESGNSEAKCTLTNDGRFLFESPLGIIYRNSTGFFEQKTDAEPEPIAIADALSKPGVLALAMQAFRYDHNMFKELGAPELDGGDYVDGHRAFRLRFTEKTDDPLFMWLSLSAPHTLLKAGFDIDGTVSRPAVTFAEPAKTKTLHWVRHRKLVTGVRSKVQKQWTAASETMVDIPRQLKGDDDSE